MEDEEEGRVGKGDQGGACFAVVFLSSLGGFSGKAYSGLSTGRASMEVGSGEHSWLFEVVSEARFRRTDPLLSLSARLSALCIGDFVPPKSARLF